MPILVDSPGRDIILDTDYLEGYQKVPGLRITRGRDAWIIEADESTPYLGTVPISKRGISVEVHQPDRLQ